MIEQFFDEFKRKYQELNQTSMIFAAITLPISLMVLMLLLSYNLMVALVPLVITVILFTIIIIISIIIVNNNDKMSELEPNVFEVRGDVKFHRFCRKFKINSTEESRKTTVGDFVKEKLSNDLAKDKRLDFKHLTISVRELEDSRVIRVVVELKPEQKDNDVNITQENSENGKGLSRKLKCTIKQLRTRLSSFVRTRLSSFDAFVFIMTLPILVSYVWFLIKGTPVDNKSGVLVIAIHVLMGANILLTFFNFAMRSLPSKTYPNAKVYKSCFIAVVVGVLLILVWVACLFELNNDKSNYINRSADELSSPLPTQLTEESAPIGTVQDVDNEAAPTESTSPEQPTPTQLTEESAPIGTVQDADNEAAPTATPSPAQSNNVKESKQNLLFWLVVVLIVVYLAYWLVDRIVEKPVIKSSDIVNMTKELLSEHEMLDEKSIDMLCEFCKTSIEDRVFGDKKERVLLLIAILGVTAEGMFEKWAGSLVDNHRIVLDITVMAVVLLAYTAWVYVKIRGIHAKEKLKLEREMLFALKTIKCNLKGSAFE